MCEVVYSVTGPSVDQKYGIVALEKKEGRCAAVMPFLSDHRAAKRYVAALNERQVPISDFCEAFLTGRFEDLV